MHQSTRLNLSFTHLTLVIWALILSAPAARAQGPGMGGGGPQNAAPAFSEPKFRDRVWEAGGPRISGLKSGKLVKSIEVVGNETVSSYKILSHMQTRVDRTYDERQLEADLHELYRTELFRKVTPKIASMEDGVIVRLEVIENPVVTEVVFHGNTRLDDSLLEKHCGIDTGDPANPFSVDMAKQRMLDLYFEKGMNQAAINVKEGSKLGDRRIFFEIFEGPVERIWSISFVGNQVFSSELLRTKIQSRDARWLVTTYMGNVANIQKIQDDARIILAYYRSLGYFQAGVDYRIEYHDDGDFMDVTFIVREGQRSVVRSVSIVGNNYAPFTTEVLKEPLETLEGEYFNLGKMNRDVRTLRNDYYGRDGFYFVDISPDVLYLDEPGKVDIVYKINEGDRYRAGEINIHIEGDTSHTKNTVVMNLLGIREGQYIDLYELERSEARLMRSQIFETSPALGEPPRIVVRPPDADGPQNY